MTKSKVAIVKVENDDIEQAVQKVVELLGGLEQFIEKDKDILLKPNLLSAPKNPEDRKKIRTDPRVVEAITRILRNNQNTVLIGDNSGIGHPGGTRSVLKRSGYLEIGEKYEGVTVRSLEKRGPIVTKIAGKKLKEANVSRDIIESESIINLPKMKTHGLTMYTGAIKNLFGTICGADKTRIHALGASIGGFSQCLVDLFSFLKPKIKLTIMDAIVAMEGRGPGVAGKPVEMNLILASDDVVALDAVAFRLMGHNPKKVPAIKLAAEQGLGQIEQDKIEIVGEKISKHKKRFKLPFSAAIARIPFARFSKIILSVPKYRGGCTNCQTCVKACPKSVITIEKNNNGEPVPQIDYSGCISCFTCSEVCPEACYVEKMKHLPHIILTIVSLLAVIGAIVTLVILL